LLSFLFYSFLCCLYSFSLYYLSFYYPAITDIYTLSLHDALPISMAKITQASVCHGCRKKRPTKKRVSTGTLPYQMTRYCNVPVRSEEHTSELQSPCNLVCRLLLEKKDNYQKQNLLDYLRLIITTI